MKEAIKCLVSQKLMNPADTKIAEEINLCYKALALNPNQLKDDDVYRFL